MYFPKVHIHLDVGDADRSTLFYEALFGAPPATRDSSLSVFEFESPPLVLTLRARQSGAGASARTPRGPRRARAPGTRRRMFGPHPRYALVVTEPEHVGTAAIALRRAGVRLRLEDQGIEASDPDGNAWRVRFVPFARERTVVAI